MRDEPDTGATADACDAPHADARRSNPHPTEEMVINLNESNCNHAGGGRHLHVRHRTAAGWNVGVNIQERDGPQRPHQRRRHADEPDGDRLFSPLYMGLAFPQKVLLCGVLQV